MILKQIDWQRYMYAKTMFFLRFLRVDLPQAEVVIGEQPITLKTV